MNLYDFLINITPEKLSEEIIKTGKWDTWKEFPENKKSFCEFFGLEDDKRISRLDGGRHAGKKAINITITINLGDPIGDFDFKIKFEVGGYKTPKVSEIDNGIGRYDFYLDRKYYAPDAKKKDAFEILTYDLANDYLWKETACKEISVAIESCKNALSGLNVAIRKVLDSYEDGSYRKIFKDANQEFCHGNYLCSSMCTPSFCILINMIFIAKRKFDYDLSVEDATYLCLYFKDQNGDCWTQPSKGVVPDKNIKFVGDWAFWNRSAYRDVENDTELTLDHVKKMIEVSKKNLKKSSDKLAEFLEAKNAANKQIIEKLTEAIESASKEFGINKKYLCLVGFAKNNTWKLFSADDKTAPSDWKLKK